MQKTKENKSGFTISDNDVPSDGQMRNSTTTCFLGNESAPHRLLIVGNSITRHGPKDDIGWNHDFGMAASCAECDYVHLLTSRLMADEDILVMVRQFASWERSYKEATTKEYYTPEFSFSADEVIFRLGENVSLKSDEEEADFALAIREFLDNICPEGTKIYFTTCFWKNERVDRAICQVAEEMQMPLIDLGDLGLYDENMAIGLFWHGGVAHHPGDLGMQRIAERLYRAMREPSHPEKPCSEKI
ncbi:MAG: SGNH/GDSL hydrolase family protein [Clostridia bacterium]|nr:SGNH/GDSL hydrolase family protein [Clostridia bacterium]